MIDMVAVTTYILEEMQKKQSQDTERLMNDWQKQFYREMGCYESINSFANRE